MPEKKLPIITMMHQHHGEKRGNHYCIISFIKGTTTAHISREYQYVFIYRICTFVRITSTITI